LFKGEIRLRAAIKQFLINFFIILFEAK